MKGKKVVAFLLLLPAFNKKNLSSILLVIVFFLLYCAVGGKVSLVPQIQTGAGFGSVDAGNVTGDVAVVSRGNPVSAAGALSAPAAYVSPIPAKTETQPAAPVVTEDSRKLDELYERLKKR